MNTPPPKTSLLLWIANAPPGEHAGEGGAIRFLLLSLFRPQLRQERPDETVARGQFGGSGNVPIKQKNFLSHRRVFYFAAIDNSKRERNGVVFTAIPKP